jgi:hypothetical protein
MVKWEFMGYRLKDPYIGQGVLSVLMGFMIIWHSKNQKKVEKIIIVMDEMENKLRVCLGILDVFLISLVN